MTQFLILLAFLVLVAAAMYYFKPEWMTKVMGWAGGLGSILASALAGMDFSILTPYVTDPKTLGIVGGILLVFAICRHIKGRVDEA